MYIYIYVYIIYMYNYIRILIAYGSCCCDARSAEVAAGDVDGRGSEDAQWPGVDLVGGHAEGYLSPTLRVYGLSIQSPVCIDPLEL